MFISFRSQFGRFHFSVFRPEFLQAPRAALGQKGLNTQYFAISRPWRSGRPNHNLFKSCAISGRNFWGGRGFCPKSAPSSGKLCFSGFGPEFLLVPRGRPRPKRPEGPVFCDFPPLGVRSAKTPNVKKLRNFWEKLLRRTDFPPKSAPRSQKSHFFVFGPEFL